MGWTTLRREPGTSALDFWNREFHPQRPDGSVDPESGVIAVASTGLGQGVDYIAYRKVRYDDDGNEVMRYVICLVCLTQWWPKAADGFNFGYKDMDESMGPNEVHCPERILKLLTPMDELVAMGVFREDGYAVRWRADAHEALALRKARPKVKDGDLVIFDTPVDFDKSYGSYDTFVYRSGGGRSPSGYRLGPKRGLYRHQTRHLIRHWREKPYRVVQIPKPEALTECAYVDSVPPGVAYAIASRTSGNAAGELVYGPVGEVFVTYEDGSTLGSGGSRGLPGAGRMYGGKTIVFAEPHPDLVPASEEVFA